MTDTGFSYGLVAVPDGSGKQRGGLDAGAVGMLTGDAVQMSGTLLELRRTLGIDEVVVPVDLAEFFRPVIARLAGRAG